MILLRICLSLTYFSIVVNKVEKLSKALDESTIAHSKPCIGIEEERALVEVVKSGFLASGPQVDNLEKELSDFVKHKHAIAFNAGTSALYICLRALNCSDKKSVVVPAYSCASLLSAICMTGAKPILCDIDPNLGYITSDDVKKVKKSNTTAVIVPHLFGKPAPIPDIEHLGIPVIEDCAHAFGTITNFGTMGSMSTFSVFSFYATKLIAGGEGGCVATSNWNLWKRCRELREYDHIEKWEPRLNLKMTDLSATCIRVQLKKLPLFIQKRKAIASYYQKHLKNLNKTIAIPTYSKGQIWFRFIIQIPKYANRLIDEMRLQGIRCERPIFKPLYEYLNQKPLKGTQQLYERSVSIPIYPSLQSNDYQRIVHSLKKCIVESMM